MIFSTVRRAAHNLVLQVCCCIYFGISASGQYSVTRPTVATSIDAGATITVEWDAPGSFNNEDITIKMYRYGVVPIEQVYSTIAKGRDDGTAFSLDSSISGEFYIVLETNKNPVTLRGFAPYGSFAGSNFFLVGTSSPTQAPTITTTTIVQTQPSTVTTSTTETMQTSTIAETTISTSQTQSALPSSIIIDTTTITAHRTSTSANSMTSVNYRQTTVPTMSSALVQTEQPQLTMTVLSTSTLSTESDPALTSTTSTSSVELSTSPSNLQTQTLRNVGNVSTTLGPYDTSQTSTTMKTARDSDNDPSESHRDRTGYTVILTAVSSVILVVATMYCIRLVLMRLEKDPSDRAPVPPRRQSLNMDHTAVMNPIFGGLLTRADWSRFSYDSNVKNDYVEVDGPSQNSSLSGAKFLI
eukprot:m.21351 g.21351  ORF g.21351 m.21351 type:complete len:412 (+) comp12397_c0_seq2:629-1864(+)